ncbi:hypothetical protein [Jeotgalibaca sp. A122]|uniref:hypothetical protein n=1 Tax=Jeotgalibaca sp. A122 TaxID=3457322 RepID=UPI003FD21476
MLLSIFGMAFGWTFVNFGFVIPTLNHLTGTTRDVSAFANRATGIVAAILASSIFLP